MEEDQKNVKIPIIYDTIRVIDGTPMLRCNYFAVQTDEPSPNWSLNFGNKIYSILLLNLEAIIIGSPKSPELFRNPGDIDDMYDSIEENPNLFVDINDIWVPHIWFKYKPFEHGSIFRLNRDLFTSCWKYRNDQISIIEFLENESTINIRNFAEERQESMVDFSAEESLAFKNWTIMQIQKSQEIYKENKNKLKKLRK